MKQAPTPEELSECATPQYNAESSPPTEQQLRNREEAQARFLALKEQNSREFDIGDAIFSGEYEVPELKRGG